MRAINSTRRGPETTVVPATAAANDVGYWSRSSTTDRSRRLKTRLPREKTQVDWMRNVKRWEVEWHPY